MNIQAAASDYSVEGPNTLMLFNMSGGVRVTNLTSVNCKVLSGALLTFLGSRTGLVSVTNSDFGTTFQAIAAMYGSLIMADTAFNNVSMVEITSPDVTYISMSRCSFFNGGQLYLSGPNVTINGSVFVNNTVKSDGYNPGGAVYITSQRFDDAPELASSSYTMYFDGVYNVAQSVFVNNSNLVYGGASVVNEGDVGVGGAVLISGSQGTASEAFLMQNCSFDSNSAVSGGGLATWGIANALIFGCNFSNNFASSGTGAAMYAYGLQPKLTFVNLEASTVNASRFGSDSTANCDVMFRSCRCAGAKSSQFWNSLGTGLCIVDVDGGQCDHAYQLPSGYVIVDYDSYGSARNDERTDFVGPLNLGNSISVDVENCTFSNHTSFPETADPFVGGAGLRLESVGVSVLSSLTFINNSARQGGALHLKACDTTVLGDSFFYSNTASHEGGAVALVDTADAGLLIAATNMTKNSALRGGAVYGGPGTAVIISNGSRLFGNNALTDGGAVYCNGCQRLTLRESAEVGNNKAMGLGGGCYLDACLLLNLTQIWLHDNQ